MKNLLLRERLKSVTCILQDMRDDDLKAHFTKWHSQSVLRIRLQRSALVEIMQLSVASRTLWYQRSKEHDTHERARPRQRWRADWNFAWYHPRQDTQTRKLLACYKDNIYWVRSLSCSSSQRLTIMQMKLIEIYEKMNSLQKL